jgi:hypothetical protein
MLRSRSRHTLKVRLARGLQRLPMHWLRWLESPLLKSAPVGGRHARLLMLLALPRSGSTLAYQVLINGFGARYISNAWNLLYQAPAIGGLVSNYLCKRARCVYDSEYGFVSGLCGPSEAFAFWKYWANCDLQDEDPTSLSNKDGHGENRLQYLESALALHSTSERPIVTGYVGHTLCPEKLQNMFFKPVFVRLRRDPLSNAYSLLTGRRKFGEKKWFSVRPRECALQGSIHAQVASQVYWLTRRLDSFTQKSQVCEIDYESLCLDTRSVLKRVSSFCNQRDFSLTLNLDVPRSFAFRSVAADDSEDARLLSEELMNLQAEHGSLTCGTS